MSGTPPRRISRSLAWLGLLASAVSLTWSPGLVHGVRAQGAGNVVTDQVAEAGALTTALTSPVTGSGAAAPAVQSVCAAGGSWVRVRFSQLVLQGSDTLELVGSQGEGLVFQGNNWANRTFFTRALTGPCATVRPTFASAGSQFTIDAYQAGAAALASTPMTTVGAGDICDINVNCGTTSPLLTGLNPAADVVFTLGDNQYDNGTLAEYNRDYALYWGQPSIKSRTRPVSGNHEYQSGNGGAGYFDYFNGVGQATGPAGGRGQGYYSYDLGEWHVVVLNTSNAGVVPYAAGSAQEQWLRQDLAANTKPCTMAQWHHPRFSRGSYRPGITATQALWQAMQDYRGDIVLSGHDHNYQRYAPQTATGVASPDGLRLFVVGTGGRAPSAFTGSVANFEAGNDVNIDGVLKLTLSATTYAWQFLPAPGTSFADSGSASCHNAPTLGVSVSPASVTLPRGQTTTATVTVSGGSRGGVPTTLASSGLPLGVTASFFPNPVTPPPGGTTTSTLTLQASGTATTGTVAVTLTGAAGTLTANTTLTLAVPGSAPVAVDDAATTAEDTPAVIPAANVTANDTDADGDALTVTAVGNAVNGTVSLAAGVVTLTPTANFAGGASFAYTVSDGTATDVGTVVVTVTAVNDPPVAFDGSATAPRGATVNGTFAATDVDSPALTYTIVSNGVFGTAVFTNAATGAFVYAPPSGSSGGDIVVPLANPGSLATETLQFKVNDGAADSNVATFVITLSPDYSPPFLANEAQLRGREDVPLAGRLSATGAASARARVALVTNGTLGTVVLHDGTTGRFVYVPNRDAAGTDTFRFQVIDGDRRSSIATVTVVLAPVNDAPVARGARYVTRPGTEVRGALVASDVDSTRLTYAVEPSAQLPGALEIVDAATGRFRFVPAPGFVGTGVFTFTVTDDGGRSGHAAVTIAVRR